MRTLLAGDAEGVCSATGDGVTDSAGEMDNSGDSPGIGEGDGVGDSWAATAEIDATSAKSATLICLVMSTEVETSLAVGIYVRISRGSSTSLGMTSGLDVVTPVHVWKKIIARFARP
jgi:hypothetical protein